jgi:hypothetical protein
MQLQKRRRTQPLVWMRRVAEVAGVLYSITLAAQGVIDVTVKVLSLLGY